MVSATSKPRAGAEAMDSRVRYLHRFWPPS